ncbi:DUF5134 domain-containing protein [Mycobacterium sp. ML4]
MGFALVIDRKSWTSIVSHGLHLTMAIAMAAMAWPQALGFPPTPAKEFFLAAALWFVIVAVLAVRTTAARMVGGYHALMMVAMAWMYAAMGGHPAPGTERRAPAVSGVNMADMAAPPHDASHDWTTTGNWIWAGVFVFAAFAWGYRFLTVRRRVWRTRVGIAVQAMMAAGMAIMFAVMVSAA